MESSNNNKMLQQLTLLLIYLNAWKEKDITGASIYRAWKGYDFEVIDRLKEEGDIEFSKTAKSLYISENGIRKAEALLEELKRTKLF